ncbi:serine/threonine protein kinase, partial [Streptomyces olivaceus]
VLESGSPDVTPSRRTYRRSHVWRTPPAPAHPGDPQYPSSYQHAYQPRHQPPPVPHPSHHPAQSLAPPPAQQRTDVPTASYTARSPQAPAQHRAPRRRRRPGPPAKVAVPLLLLALACYAVGFWALTRI